MGRWVAAKTREVGGTTTPTNHAEAQTILKVIGKTEDRRHAMELEEVGKGLHQQSLPNLRERLHQPSMLKHSINSPCSKEGKYYIKSPS